MNSFLLSIDEVSEKTMQKGIVRSLPTIPKSVCLAQDLLGLSVKVSSDSFVCAIKTTVLGIRVSVPLVGWYSTKWGDFESDWWYWNVYIQFLPNLDKSGLFLLLGQWSIVMSSQTAKRKEKFIVFHVVGFFALHQFFVVKYCVDQEKDWIKDLGLVLNHKDTKIFCFLYLPLRKILNNHERGCVANPKTFSLKRCSALKKDLVLQYDSSFIDHVFQLKAKDRHPRELGLLPSSLQNSIIPIWRMSWLWHRFPFNSK